MKENKLIAVFMEYPTKLTCTYLADSFKLLYQDSWDWLMPVVKKIDQILFESYLEIASEDVINPQELINRWWLFEHRTLQYTNDQLKCGTDIKEVYDDVVDFINFYNKYNEEKI